MQNYPDAKTSMLIVNTCMLLDKEYLTCQILWLTCCVDSMHHLHILLTSELGPHCLKEIKSQKIILTDTRKTHRKNAAGYVIYSTK